MNNKDYELVNCGNYFTEDRFKNLCDKIDAGNKCGIYIDCIGHTRDLMETNHYVNELKKHYGDKLKIDNESTWYPLYYI